MNQMLEVFSIDTYKDKDGKERKEFTRCGVAFPRKKEEGYVLKIKLQNRDGDYLLSKKKEWKES